MKDLQYVKSLKSELESRYTKQRTLDDDALAHYLQTHKQNVRQPASPNLAVQPVGAGLAPFLVDQKVSVWRTTPTIRFIPRGGAGAEKHASDKLEPFAQAALHVTQEYAEYENKIIQDGGVFGAAWLLGPMPNPWNADKIKGYIESKDLDAIEEYKQSQFPIIAQHIPHRSVMPSFAPTGELDEVLIKRKMTVRDIKRKWGLESLPPKGYFRDYKDTELIEVYDHLDDGVYCTYTFVGKETGLAEKSVYEHHMGCVPMCYFPFAILPENDRGWFWKGLLFNGREIFQSIDETLTDIRTAIHENVISKPVVYLNYEQRGSLEGWPTRMNVDDESTINMLVGEKADRYPSPEIVNDAYAYLDRTTSILGVTSIRESLAGEGPSGQSAVHLNIGYQAAQGELAEGRLALTRGYTTWVKLLLKSVKAINHGMPEGADDNVTIRSADLKKGYKEISISPKDIEGWEHLGRADVQLNLPINEGAAVQNYSVAVQSGGLDPYSARERYLGVQNPLEIDEKIAEHQLYMSFIQLANQMVLQRAQGTIAQQGALGDEQLGVAAQSLPDFAQQALQQSYGSENGQQVLGNVARGLTSEARAGRGQQMSELSATNTGVPNAP